ncbi:MAG TPA: porin [Polyangia bacterium]|nr:porin [Polyangia bacterium]
MPVRPYSVGFSLIIPLLALLAAGRATAAGRDDPTEVDEETPPPKTKAKSKTEPRPKAEPKPKAEQEPKVEVQSESETEAAMPRPPEEPKPEAAPPEPATDIEAPGAGRALETVGFSDRLFVRSPGDEVVLFPGGRVQIDGAAFPRQTPKSGIYVRRARLELAGWLGRIFYFDASADFAPSPPAGSDAVAPSALPATDNYVALAPFGESFILQAGQFDAPFTLENRTSDAYTTFIERSLTVRAVGVPRNKEVGVMAHGLLGGGLFYYSAGAFNGDGPDFRNFDNQIDAIGRATVSPFARGEGIFRRLTLGGSAWYGRHVLGPVFPPQATAGGVPFVVPTWTSAQPPVNYELRENGTVAAFAGELSIPFGTHVGLRVEGVFKQQQLAEAVVATGNAPIDVRGNATLTGRAAYGELWLWLAGDERMLPAPGLELPSRVDRRYRRAFEDGLQLALRGEYVQDDVTTNNAMLGDPARATTRVISGVVGANYWRGSLARISINYVVNVWSGTSETVNALHAESQFEHELMLRFAISL